MQQICGYSRTDVSKSAGSSARQHSQMPISSKMDYKTAVSPHCVSYRQNKLQLQATTWVSLLQCWVGKARRAYIAGFHLYEAKTKHKNKKQKTKPKTKKSKINIWYQKTRESYFRGDLWRRWTKGFLFWVLSTWMCSLCKNWLVCFWYVYIYLCMSLKSTCF